ncbi:MAG: site-2 protease family protein [Verrucomicrobiota bacterium]|nr:site-2 protease family protein [Verrucomicrobiota bacterium]
MPTRQGSIHLFRLFGIDVYLHWAWFLAAAYFVNEARGYSSPVWSVLECLSLFLIVLIHEFGHQLACRQVGGQTSVIVLWPLGGVAYVNPPQRPGAQLWSIAAGPLVNVVLFPILSILFWLGTQMSGPGVAPDWLTFLRNVWVINLVLLIFNMLPIYPLDGGQILRSLLWFVVGRANSLLAASIIGFAGVAVLIGLALLARDFWLGIMCAFILLNCWGGLMQARSLARVANAPRRESFACPNCRTPPPRGAFWRCGRCRQPFDTFETQGVCPHCGVQYSATSCPECGSLRPFSEWESFGQTPPPS